MSLECFNNWAETDTDFLNRVITGDETRVYGYDPETQTQSLQWKGPSSPQSKKHDKVGRM